MTENETNRGFQGVREVSSGHLSFSELAREVFGMSLLKLRNNYPFFDGEFYNPASGDLMPVIDLEDMLSHYCSEANSPVFLGTMTQSAGYATPQSWMRAVTSVGSRWPIPQNGPASSWWMEQSSY